MAATSAVEASAYTLKRMANRGRRHATHKTSA
jgi:hypothetical protein